MSSLVKESVLREKKQQEEWREYLIIKSDNLIMKVQEKVQVLFLNLFYFNKVWKKSSGASLIYFFLNNLLNVFRI